MGSIHRLTRKSWVEYGTRPDIEDAVPAITLASKSLPKKYTDIPKHLHGTDMGERYNGTVRACIPFRDAMTEGLIIPFPFDLVVESSMGGKEIRWYWGDEKNHDSFLQDGVQTHDARQFGDFYSNHVLKIPSPYFIKTSNNLLALYGPLTNREVPLRPFSGLINHAGDGYACEVNIPCGWIGEDGLHKFRQGEPLAQVVFVPRKKPSMRQATFDGESQEVLSQKRRLHYTADAYLKHWRAKGRE